MKNFTKAILVVTLTASHLLGFAVKANSLVVVKEASEGVSPTYKGGNTVWKLVEGNRGGLVLSAQNAKVKFVNRENEHTCSKIYSAAVSPSFHAVELHNTNKTVFASAMLMAYAPVPGGNGLIKDLPSINAYPNPSRGITRLTLSQTNGENYKIRITNTIGKVIRTVALPSIESADVAHVELDMTTYPAGVYFYSLLVNDKTVETKRLVLQK
ncbi:T9SS type A sorting domain-containing protein [Pontibacter harenae]|uniref:T9SS type A sorting domain-containing protein n=1 Tax=Pontibacter harenae TaxID=2894083 RepID=UPI001E4A33E1|nr:T9SS type A sorting domain-containing protein [Pontibacter harenae]MCC9168476.1 T9SS type A sorting domain-containing protein [Pontibacter harenae]